VTQRVWETTDGWNVLTGWDRPLQRFFLQISRQCAKCVGDGSNNNDDGDCEQCNGRGEEFLFDNLDDKTGMTDQMGGMSIDQINQVLKLKLTAYPDNLLTFLNNDRVRNLGNDRAVMETIGEAKR